MLAICQLDIKKLEKIKQLQALKKKKNTEDQTLEHSNI